MRTNIEHITSFPSISQGVFPIYPNCLTRQLRRSEAIGWRVVLFPLLMKPHREPDCQNRNRRSQANVRRIDFCTTDVCGGR